MGEVIDESFRFRSEQRLRELKTEHRDLDAAIARLIEDPLHDELLLKDQIALLLRQLDPDIRA